MSITISRVDREFSPAEAAEITGVSVALQRDWRRRGILPENKSGKWTKFALTDVIQMSVMKSFSDAGFSVQYVAEFASIAVLPTLAVLDSLPGVAVFEGDNISDALKARTLGHSVAVRGPDGEVRGADQIGGRYLVMIKNPATDTPSISRWNALDGLDDFMAEQKVVHCTIMDCHLLAELIAERATPPLIRFEVSATEEAGRK